MRSQHLDRWDNIGSSAFSFQAKVIRLVDDLLSEHAVVLNHDLTGLQDHIVKIFLDSVCRLESLFVSLEESQERNDIVLSRCVAHGVKGTHETKSSLHLSLGNLPMLFEEE